jgi:DNA methylase
MLRAPARTPNHRLHALCPYFAMFPPAFAKTAIIQTSRKRDFVLDPFSGRGTTLLEALLNGRNALACDINPVASVVSRAKASPPLLVNLLHRIQSLKTGFEGADLNSLVREALQLPEFFGFAFHESTLSQILFLREGLNWSAERTDCFIAALCLGHLHGESDRSPNFFSNQMAHTIAMKPAYALRYWKKYKMTPPLRDAFAILASKAVFRLSTEAPKGVGIVQQGDAREAADLFADYHGRVAAIVTSPPYLDVTNFEEDQWLRLWFLGGEPCPTYGRISGDDRHSSATKYFQFLSDVWAGVQPLLKKSANLTCRIAAKGITEIELANGLFKSVTSVWPKARLTSFEKTGLRNRQTESFCPGSSGCGSEYDFQFAVS